MAAPPPLPLPHVVLRPERKRRRWEGGNKRKGESGERNKTHTHKDAKNGSSICNRRNKDIGNNDFDNDEDTDDSIPVIVTNSCDCNDRDNDDNDNDEEEDNDDNDNEKKYDIGVTSNGNDVNDSDVMMKK